MEIDYLDTIDYYWGGDYVLLSRALILPSGDNIATIHLSFRYSPLRIDTISIKLNSVAISTGVCPSNIYP